jgi:hypothetical protein
VNEKAFEFESIICNQIGYENLTNIRKETGWGGHAHQPETILKLSKSVIQYDLNGNFITNKFDKESFYKNINKTFFTIKSSNFNLDLNKNTF